MQPKDKEEDNDDAVVKIPIMTKNDSNQNPNANIEELKEGREVKDDKKIVDKDGENYTPQSRMASNTHQKSSSVVPTSIFLLQKPDHLISSQKAGKFHSD